MRQSLAVCLLLLISYNTKCHVAKAWSTHLVTRKSFLALIAPVAISTNAEAKCTDIESCRAIGEQKEAEKLALSPITRLGGGLEYKVLSAGTGDETVSPESKIKIIYSISQANGDYMYSQGFGYNKIDAGGGSKVSDFIDALPFKMGSTEIPIGVQKALLGAKRGERRRIVCPPKLGFETSNWQPEPKNFRGQRQIADYKALLEGRGSAPPYLAPTIWDVEVVSFR